MTDRYPEPREHRLATRPNEKTLLERIAGYTLAACKVITTTPLRASLSLRLEAKARGSFSSGSRPVNDERPTPIG